MQLTWSLEVISTAPAGVGAEAAAAAAGAAGLATRTLGTLGGGSSTGLRQQGQAMASPQSQSSSPQSPEESGASHKSLCPRFNKRHRHAILKTLRPFAQPALLSLLNKKGETQSIRLNEATEKHYNTNTYCKECGRRRVRPPVIIPRRRIRNGSRPRQHHPFPAGRPEVRWCES